MIRCKYRNHGSGDCPNYEHMKKHFVKRGDWLDCAGCCQMCIKRKSCGLACEEVAQISIEDYTEEAKNE